MTTTRQPVTNLPYIIKSESHDWVKKFPRGVYQVQDLMQEAEILLLRCQQLYNPAKSLATFDTYFTASLRNKFKNLLHRAWRMYDGDEYHSTNHTDITPETTRASDLLVGLSRADKTELKVIEALCETDGSTGKVAEMLGLGVDIVDRYKQQLRQKIGL